MPEFVGETAFHEGLFADYLSKGLSFYLAYPSNMRYPATPLIVNWEQWERFVAWVELQRKEEALETLKKLNS